MEVKREIRENDRKAPRLGKSEFSCLAVSKELYEKWIEDNEEYQHFSYKDFRDIWDKIADEIRSETCNNSLGIYFPYYTGETKIQFLPVELKAIDIDASYEVGEKVNQLNINTKGKIAKITWQRKRASNFNKMLHLFGFEQDRKFSKEVSESLANNPHLYRTMKIINMNYDKSRDNITSKENN